jgi:hypothetical protein
MLKKLVIMSGLLLTSVTAHATVISHFGYERDSATNIVTGGGLEWLKWDATKGMSINSALSAHAAQGWRSASYHEMVTLFNTFQFGPYVFTSDETISQQSNVPWNPGESSNHNAFMDLFGHTFYAACSTVDGPSCYSMSDPARATMALFGNTLAMGDLHSVAWIGDDNSNKLSSGQLHSRSGHQAAICQSCYLTQTDPLTVGVALVREFATPPVNVPTPAPIGLLALGLVALGYRRRQVLAR